MGHRIVWFDIPVLKLDRAIEFYTHVLALKITKDFPDMPVGVFEHSQDEVSGCLFQSVEDQPSAHGPLLYFGVAERLDEAIKLVEKYGGKIIKPKHQIGPYGFRAVILDSEGNRIALHSEK